MSAAARGVAAFDFDGTLVRGDSLPRYLIRLLGRQRFATVLASSALPMGLGYRKGGRDGAKTVLLSRAVAGIPVATAAEVGENFASVLADQVRPPMARRLAWHAEHGHKLVLVSASLSVYLEAFGRLAGFDHVIATRLEQGPDGRLTGRLNGANVRAAQKAVLLRELIGPDPVTLWAYGDSRGDYEMLAMADHPTLLVRGRPRRA